MFFKTEIVTGLAVLIGESHQTAVDNGFWGDAPEESKHRNFGEAIALIHSECSEALEAHRKNQGEEKIIEELWDIVIRTFDLIGSYNNKRDVDILLAKMAKNKERAYKHGHRY